LYRQASSTFDIRTTTSCWPRFVSGMRIDLDPWLVFSISPRTRRLAIDLPGGVFADGGKEGGRQAGRQSITYFTLLDHSVTQSLSHSSFLSRNANCKMQNGNGTSGQNGQMGKGSKKARQGKERKRNRRQRRQRQREREPSLI
jgi:hypothetical protein